MEHIAIMKKSWNLISKILSGEKTIESRWYSAKFSPWDRIKSGETIYFKETGFPVTAKAEVSKVLQFSDITPKKVRVILDKYHKQLGIKEQDKLYYFERFRNKQYCILIFLKNPQKTEPFDINKKGFGLMAAWICVDNINKIRK